MFAIYGGIAAYLLPRIFRNAMNVVPMKPVGLRGLFDAFPLEPTSQNITTAIYMGGTAFCALLVSIVIVEPKGATRFVKTSIVITWVHSILGIASTVGAGTFVQSILSIFRNGNYAQVDQSTGGYARINGIMPEASAYAAYGMFWAILMTELWLRNVMPRRTGLAAALMSLVLVASTSSTAYVGIAAYVIILFTRFIVFPTPNNGKKAVILVAFLLVLTVVAAFVVLLKPSLADSLFSILKHMTVDKVDSTSGEQRSFWAYQGFDAFVISHGLGIGPGSFRSSSLFTAIIGSVGIIGSIAFATYCIKVLKPLRSSTYFIPRDLVEATGVAASWAAILALIPLAVTNPSSDPGLAFALFAGAALGLRSSRQYRAKPQSLHRLLALPPLENPAPRLLI